MSYWTALVLGQVIGWLLVLVVFIFQRRCHMVRTRNDAFDWGCYAVKWWWFGKVMLCKQEHPDHWVLLWWTDKKLLEEFDEALCK